MERTEEAVRALSEKMIENEGARDFEAIGSFYAPNAVFQAANRPLLKGRQEILDTYREVYATMLEFEAEVSKVVASESADLAFEWGTNRIVVESPDGPVELIGKYSRGWKNVEGTWQILLQTYSADVMPPA